MGMPRHAQRLLRLLALVITATPLAQAASPATPLIVEYPLPAGISNTRSITAGPDGNLWFTAADLDLGRLGRCTTSGTITTFPSSGYHTPSIEVTPGPDGALWFTADSNFGRGIGRMTVDGTLTDIFRLQPPLHGPRDITTGPDGNLWFTDVQTTTGAIGRLTPTGVFSQFATPRGAGDITSGPDGNLWYTAANKIGRMTTAGVVTEFALPGYGALNIVSGPDGNLWYTRQDKIGRITPGGVVTEFKAIFSGTTVAITAGLDGNLWFTAGGANPDNPNTTLSVIGRITPSGSVTTFVLPNSPSLPLSIAAGSDGNIWFTDDGNNKLGKLVLNPHRMTLPLLRR
jgi:streptogramin lyase